MSSSSGPSPYDGRGLSACVLPGHTSYPFCNTSLELTARVYDLITRIQDTDKPNLLTARGCSQCKKQAGDLQHDGDGANRAFDNSDGGRLDGYQEQQSLPYLGVPAYYWGTNWCAAVWCASCTHI